MKYNKFYLFSGIISIFSIFSSSSLVHASRSDFYGDNDHRPQLFKLLDDQIGTIKITLEDDAWASMKKKTEVEPWTALFAAEDFETNNATMEFSIKGTDYQVTLNPGEFTFELGGKGSRNFVKPGYNIKIEKRTLYEVKTLRIRSTARDATLIREKLSSDLLYKMGIPTTSANYVTMEVNGEDLGLFVLTNKIKKDFISRYFDDKNTENLYECILDHNRFEDNTMYDNCQNTKEELVGNKEDLKIFVDTINKAQSVEDIAKVLDVDHFLKSIAFELLTLSWDQFLGYNHNFYWYKNSDGKWMIILNDFDETFGQDYSAYLFVIYDIYADRSYIPGNDELYLPNVSLRDLDLDNKLLKYLIYEDDTRFRQIIGEVVEKVFNPKVLNPRIDEIADLIRDELANSRANDETTGRCKGCFNVIGLDPQWNMTHFEDVINYTNWNSNISYTYSPALKYFIEARFKYICHTYGINPDTLKLIEPRPKASFWGIKNKNKVTVEGDFSNDPLVKFTYPDIDKEDFMQEAYNADPEKNNKPTGYEYPPFRYEMEEDINNNDNNNNNNDNNNGNETINDGDNTNDNGNETINDNDKENLTPTEVPQECWSEVLGYPCCQSSCHVITSDGDGDWGYEANHWCGIPSSCVEEKCWSIKHGYPCCTSSCHIYDSDEDGDWGYEDHHWCGIVKENCN
eukprot:jgi/Orpsp1_1/1182346/evm.model.c7180000080922.1